MNAVLKYIIMTVSLVVFSSELFSQVKPRVEGLEDNVEYMALMEEQYSLEKSQDSILQAISKKKEGFSQLSDEEALDATNVIINMEGALFEIRSKLGISKDKSGVIEQEFIIAGLERGDVVLEQSDVIEENLTDTDVLKSDIVKGEVPEDVYKIMLTEADVVKSIDSDFKLLSGKVALLKDIKASYITEGDMIIGDSLAMAFDSIALMVRLLNDEATEKWDVIYSAKKDQYSVLLDRFGAPSTVIERLNDESRNVRNEEANIELSFMASNISKYIRQRKLMMLYERELAAVLKMNAAYSTISDAMNKLDIEGYDIANITLPMQDMILYKPLTRITAQAHTSANPPTELIVPTKGELHKVEITTTAKKLIYFGALSRVSPVEYQELQSGKYRYWAGSYKTLEEAEAAVKTLAKYSIRTKVASWKDGVNSADSTLNVGAFKVEIPFYTTTAIAVVEEMAPGKQIESVEETIGADTKTKYYVTLFKTRKEAAVIASLIDGAEVVYVPEY